VAQSDHNAKSLEGDLAILPALPRLVLTTTLLLVGLLATLMLLVGLLTALMLLVRLHPATLLLARARIGLLTGILIGIVRIGHSHLLEGFSVAVSGVPLAQKVNAYR
jgi:hypothetical protein